MGLASMIGRGWAAFWMFQASPERPADPVTLDWRAPPSCPSEPEFRALLRSQLPPESEGRARSARHFEVEVESSSQASSGFVAIIRSRDAVALTAGPGLRRIEHPSSCLALSRGIALVIALALAEGQKQTSPAATEPATDARLATRRSNRNGQLEPSVVDLQASGWLGHGWLPGVGPGLGVRATWQQGWRVGLGGQYFFQRRQPWAAATTVRTAFLGWLVEVYSGYQIALGSRVVLPLDLGLQFGLVHGRAEGFAGARSARAPWLGLTLEVGFELRLHRHLAVSLAAQPFLSLRRPFFEISGVGQVHRPAVFGVRARLGLSVKFPAWNRRGPATKQTRPTRE